MNSKINELLTGIYDYSGAAMQYCDTDSTEKNSLIKTNLGQMTIEDLFEKCANKWAIGEKEYASDDTIQVMGYNPIDKKAEFEGINYVYRHKVNKGKFKITTSTGESVIVTEDHSIMIEDNNGNLIEKKPKDLSNGDMLIKINNKFESFKTFLEKVEDLGNFDNEYVYDIGVASNNPYFFGNDILVHNSGYFSAYGLLDDDFEWTKENVVALYDNIGKLTNESFQGFMAEAFNCPPDNGKIIKATRELCGTKAIFITKKRYAIMVFDKEGKRKDKDGKPGELKIMGLDLKRADTPQIVQNFLLEVLTNVLTGSQKEQIIEQITKFRQEFRDWPGWLKGTPKRVNNLTKYTKLYESQLAGSRKNEKGNTITIPGHVQAAINWNRLRTLYNDQYSMEIQDGFKTIVCKLKPNPAGIASVGYPIDELNLPNWYKELPFDHELMEETLIDKKVENLLSVLDWRLNEHRDNNNFGELFSF